MGEITQKIVGDATLGHYDSKIKQWFETKVEEVTHLEPVYHEDSRILEFVEKTSTASE